MHPGWATSGALPASASYGLTVVGPPGSAKGGHQWRGKGLVALEQRRDSRPAPVAAGPSGCPHYLQGSLASTLPSHVPGCEALCTYDPTFSPRPCEEVLSWALFTEKETEAQSGRITCSRTKSRGRVWSRPRTVPAEPLPSFGPRAFAPSTAVELGGVVANLDAPPGGSDMGVGSEEAQR